MVWCPGLPLSGRYAIVKPIAVGNKIHELARLQESYGRGKWRKCKGKATIQMTNTGEIRFVELHWYEAQGIGRRKEKIKRDLD